MKYIEDLGKKLSATQKYIVAIFVPAVLLVVTLAITDNIDTSFDSYVIWIIFLGIVGYFEFKLFSPIDNK